MTSFMTHSKEFSIKISNAHAISAISALLAIWALAEMQLKIKKLGTFSGDIGGPLYYGSTIMMKFGRMRLTFLGFL